MVAHGLQPLGATAEGGKVDIAAIWTGARDAGFEPAVVAAQAPVHQVDHQIGGTAVAARDPATGAAGQHRRVAAPVEKDQALLAECGATLDGGQCGFSRPVSMQRPAGIASATARSGNSSRR